MSKRWCLTVLMLILFPLISLAKTVLGSYPSGGGWYVLYTDGTYEYTTVPPTNNAPPPPPGNGTPINNGLVLLLIAGVGYGVKKLYDKNNSAESKTLS